MHCRDVRDLADSYVGGELPTETNQAILTHLKTCLGCRAEIHARRALRAALRQAFERAPSLEPRRAFAAELGAALREAAAAQPRARRRHGLARWFALAATVLIACTVVFYASRRARDPDGLLAAAVGDHRNCALHFQLAERPVPLDEAARRFDGAFGTFEQVPAVVTSTVRGDARVLERHACVYGGRRFAHIVLRYRGTPVSLVAARARDASAVAPSSARVDGMNVVRFRAGTHDVFLVGDLPDSDLRALESALVDAIAQGLRRA